MVLNYCNGKIYKLTNNKDSMIYIGSTCNSLDFRLKGHISSACTELDRYVYHHLNIIGWQNVKIELIENYKCNCRTELFKRERYFIELLNPDLNTTIPYRSESEKIELRKEYEKKPEVIATRKEANHTARHITPLIICPCGGTPYSYPDRLSHFASRQHQVLMRANGEDMTAVNHYVEKRREYEKRRELRRFPKQTTTDTDTQI